MENKAPYMRYWNFGVRVGETMNHAGNIPTSDVMKINNLIIKYFTNRILSDYF